MGNGNSIDYVTMLYTCDNKVGVFFRTNLKNNKKTENIQDTLHSYGKHCHTIDKTILTQEHCFLINEFKADNIDIPGYNVIALDRRFKKQIFN